MKNNTLVQLQPTAYQVMSGLETKYPNLLPHLRRSIASGSSGNGFKLSSPITKHIQDEAKSLARRSSDQDIIRSVLGITTLEIGKKKIFYSGPAK